MGGGRVTCCKSGKDRTGMAVTAEHQEVLSELFPRARAPWLLETLRVNGVRRANVLCNTGLDQFAFNSIQVSPASAVFLCLCRP
jgi:hypothetical protein